MAHQDLALLENNLVLIGLGAVIFILIFIVCCMLMKMRSKPLERRNTFESVGGSERQGSVRFGSERFGSEMKDIYDAEADANKRPSEMSLAHNESDRYA